MNIKQINEMYESMKTANLSTTIGNPDFNKKLVDLISELDNHCDVSKNVVTSVMSEQDFVKLMLMIQKMTVTAMVAQGDLSILEAELSGSLQGYTHTVVLSVIGLLISEEIL